MIGHHLLSLNFFGKKISPCLGLAKFSLLVARSVTNKKLLWKSIICSYSLLSFPHPIKGVWQRCDLHNVPYYKFSVYFEEKERFYRTTQTLSPGYAPVSISYCMTGSAIPLYFCIFSCEIERV